MESNELIAWQKKQAVMKILNKFLFIGQVVGMKELSQIESACLTFNDQQTASLQAECDRWENSAIVYEAKLLALQAERTSEQAAALNENKKLRNLLAMVLDIDAMTTKEFCDMYRQDHPAYRGSIDLAVMEMFAVDSHKWHLIKDRAKEVRTALNQS